MNTTDDPRWNDTSVTPGSGNVFVDLGFDPAEAEVMKLRAEVMIRTAQRLKDHGSAELPEPTRKAIIKQLGLN